MCMAGTPKVLALAALFLVPSSAGAWRDGDKYNVCKQINGVWQAVQIPKEEWEAAKAAGAFPYEKPDNHKPPFDNSWCVEHAPKTDNPKPAGDTEVKPNDTLAPRRGVD
jgi:hypothetical protein